MGVDIRLPLGSLFAVTGFMLLVYGLMTRGSAMYNMSLGINLNVIWGAMMLCFGLVMVWLGRPRRG